MPLARPPAAPKLPPASAWLPAGTRLWRVHPRSWPGDEFNDVRSDPHFGGNRFDSTPADPFPYLYAAVDPQTALLETLVKGMPFDDSGKRVIRRSSVRDLRLSAIELGQDLRLISLLTTTDLARASQDRRWCQWLRARAPWAQGMIWPSARSLGSQSLVLFGDRIAPSALRVPPGSTIELDSADGAAWLNRRLRPYLISVRPPARPRRHDRAEKTSDLTHGLRSKRLAPALAERR